MEKVKLSIDVSKLENVKRSENGAIHAACPACRAAGSDKSGHHLFIMASGKYGCAAHPGDAAHRKEIFRLVGLIEKDISPAPANITKPPGKSQIEAVYDYHDAGGKLVFQVVRFHPKKFLQRQPDGKGGWLWKMDGVEKVLFRLPEILLAVQRGLPVFICEGERDVNSVAQRGFDATCNPGGAGKWQDSFSESLRAADVFIIADKDKAGRDHAQLVAGKLHGVAKSVRVIELPDTNGQPVKDAADFFAAGGDAQTLIQLADTAPAWTPPDTAANSRRAAVASEYIGAEAEKTAAAAAAGGAPAARDDLTEFEYANLLAAKLPPIKTSGKEWFAYREGAWQKIQRSTLRPVALDILPPGIRTARRESTLLDHLEGRNQVAADAFRGFYRFDGPDTVLINAANGIVRVTASANPELLPHSENHLFTYRTAARFDPHAGAELFLTKLGEMLPDEQDRDLLQLCFGNFLLPDCRFETALVCYGEAGRGKSTLAEPVAAALGGDLVARLSLNQICDSRSYHLPKIRFAAVNLGTELDVIAVDESANFKTIVSGEPVEARPIYGEPFTMQTASKLWFLANGLPRFRHGTEAEQRRTRFIRFDHQPKEKDVTLKSRLLAERDGVFNFMLAGLRRLLTLSEIPLGGAESQAVHARFKISNDPLGSFITAHCVFEAEARESKEALKNAFAEFCEKHGTPPDFADFFFKRLYERFTTLKEVRVGMDGDRVRCVAGIRLKSILETE